MKISPSILTCDFSNIKSEINEIKDDVEYIHFDVMDGCFVPNLTFGPKFIADLRNHYTNIFDVHLMIDEPLKYIKEYSEAGSDIITFHYESKSNVMDTIKEITKYGKKIGLSIKPNTSVKEILEYLPYLDMVLVMSVEPGFGGQKFMESSITKINELSELKKTHNYHYEINVDGGINDKTVSLVKQAGVDVVVAGSYIMNSNEKKVRIDILRNK